MAEDQALGVDAEFTVNVDGQQVGGVQTVTASQSAGQTEPFTFDGNWGPGQHDVTVSFVNNFIYPGQSGDRNVYVDGVTYDGQTVSNTTTPIYQTAFYTPNNPSGEEYGNAVFQVNDTTAIPAGASSTPTTSPPAVSIGSGSDTLVLNMAEDPFDGDAQFTVAVDGQQIGGTQTTSAVVDDGQFQAFDVNGNFGPGTHTVSVTFTNDAVGGYYPAGTPGLPAGTQWALDTQDRNLYVMGMSLDGGTPASGAPYEISSNGTENFSVTAGNNPSATATNSGLFATDGAAASPGNPAIPTGAMSFISSSGSSTPSTTTASTTDPSSSSDGSSSTSDAAPTVASVTSGTSQSTSDFTVPSTSSSSGSDSSSSSGGSSGTVWTPHPQGSFGGSGHNFHG